MNYSETFKNKRIIPIVNGDTLTPEVQTLFHKIKNKFGFVTCIGSEDFYLYTRQMMLHLNLQQANDMSDYIQHEASSNRNIQFGQQEKLSKKLKSPPKMKKYNSNYSQMDTSFAKASQQCIKQLLKTQINQITSQYELSNIQLKDKSVQSKSRMHDSCQNLNLGQPQLSRSNSIQKKLLNISNQIIQFCVYSECQIGTTKQKNPIQWIYCQIRQVKPQTIKLAFLLSSCLIFEIPLGSKNSQSAKKLQKQVQIKKIKLLYQEVIRQLSIYQDDQKNAVPQIILISNIHQNDNQQKEKEEINTLFSKYFGKKQNQALNSPFYQYQLTTPSKSHLPPTPKRFPLSIKQQNNYPRVRLQFRIVSENLSKSGVLRQDYSRMRQITLQGKSIFNEMYPKFIQGNLTQPFCYIQLLQGLLSVKFHQNFTILFYQEWQKVYSKYLQSNIQQTIEDYKDKISQLTLGKSIISHQKLEQAHEIAKKQTLKHLSQKKIGKSRVLIKSINSIKSGLIGHVPSPSQYHIRKISISRKLQQSKCSLNDLQYYQEEEDLVHLVQSKLNILKQEMDQKNKVSSMSWGQKFLQSEYKKIQKKLLVSQLKSVSMFKQQLFLFRQFFMKKLQMYSAYQADLIAQYEKFVFNKIFQGLNILMQKQKDEILQTVKKLQNNKDQLQAEIKQLKKKTFIKQRDVSQAYEELLNKNQQQTIIIQNLHNALEQLENKYQVQKGDLEMQITKLETNVFTLQNSCKAKISQKDSELDQIKIKLQTIGFQLQKQQLLHQQTHQNYSQIISVMKNGETKLNSKLQKLTQQTTANQNKLKESSYKQHQQTQQVKREYDVQIKNLQNQIEVKDFEIQRLINQTRKSKDIHQFQIVTLKQSLGQCQKDNKNLQDKIIQMQFQIEKNKSLQNNTNKIIQEKDQINIKNRQAQQTLALLQQKQTFILTQLEQYKHKNVELSNKYNATFMQAQKWKQVVQNKKRQSSKQIQTEQDQIHQQLELALKTVTILQQQYAKIKKNQLNTKILVRSPIFSHLK